MAENVKQIAERPHDAGCDDEVAVENPPGGRYLP